MNASTKITHWTSALAMAGACALAHAGEAAPIWVENENFEVAVCATAAAVSPEQFDATVSALRARAESQLDDVLRASGVQLTQRQLMLLTPVEGAMACAGRDSQITFRATAVDQRSSRYWTAQMTVVGTANPIDSVTLDRLAGDLARQFGGVAVATLK